MMVGETGYVHVESPQLVRTRSGFAIFGDNALVATVTDSGFGHVAGWPRGPRMLAGMLARTGGPFAPLALHAHLRSFIAVRAVGDNAGSAHVFWGESPDTTAEQFLHVRALMYARFDGTSWSEPERVLTDSTMEWNDVYTSITTMGNDVHVLIPVDTRGGPTLHVRRRASGAWVIKRYPIHTHYTALTVLPNGTLLAGYIPSGSPSDRGVVIALASTDSGASWSEPRTIRRTGRGDAYALHFVPARHDLYAVWESSPPRTEAHQLLSTALEKHDSIQAAISTDSGKTWTTLPGLAVAGGVSGLVAAADSSGLVHLAFQTKAPDSTRVLAAAALEHGRWVGPTTIGPGPFWPTIAVPNRDSVVVMWDDWRSAGPERAPMTWWATYGCAQSPTAR
jgi:hypothetical protein